MKITMDDSSDTTTAGQTCSNRHCKWNFPDWFCPLRECALYIVLSVVLCVRVTGGYRCSFLMGPYPCTMEAIAGWRASLWVGGQRGARLTVRRRVLSVDVPIFSNTSAPSRFQAVLRPGFWRIHLFMAMLAYRWKSSGKDVTVVRSSMPCPTKGH